MTEQQSDIDVVEELFTVIQGRKGGDPETSHTAKLFAAGRGRIAQKLGEEAVETVIEAIRDDTEAIRSESADLLYHLLVLWADAGIRPEEVWAKLRERRGISGVAEKRNRAKT